MIGAVRMASGLCNVPLGMRLDEVITGVGRLTHRARGRALE
jgi:hypothetical protein